MANASLKAGWACLTGLLLAACASTRPTHHWWSTTGLASQDIERVIRDHPLASDQNIRVVNLGVTDAVSHHVVQVRVAESFHVHAHHDLTVQVYRGHGQMRIGDREFPVQGGDVLFVPRGVPHAFRNGTAQPAVALVIFNPAFDGKDTISLDDAQK